MMRRQFWQPVPGVHTANRHIKCNWKGSGFNSSHPLHNAAQCLHRRSSTPFCPCQADWSNCETPLSNTNVHDILEQTYQSSRLTPHFSHIVLSIPFPPPLPFTIWWQHRCDHLPQNLLQALDNAKTNLQVSGCTTCWFEKSSELQVSNDDANSISGYSHSDQPKCVLFTPNNFFSYIFPHMIVQGSFSFSLRPCIPHLLPPPIFAVNDKFYQTNFHLSYLPLWFACIYTYTCIYIYRCK